MIVRPFAYRDIAPCLHMAGEFHRASWQRDFNFSPAKVTALMEDILMSPAMAGFVLCREDDLPVGYIAGVVAPMYFGTDLNANDLGFFILPDYQTPMAARQLIRPYEEWATAKGAREINLGVSAGIEQDRIGRFYEKLGYTKGFSGYTKKTR